MTSTNPDQQSATADPSLAALAVLEGFSRGDHSVLDVLLTEVGQRELAMGLVTIGDTLIGMVGKAIGATQDEVVAHLRSMVLNLVSDGSLDAGGRPSNF